MIDVLKGLNQDQLDAVKTVNGPVLIIAGAGSGKTRAITHRLAYLIHQGVRPERIMALTFTNKAAQEMRERVNKLLNLKVDKSNSSNIKTNKLANSQTSFVGTFHSLGARILRREITELGRPSNFIIYDDKDSLKLIKEITAELNIDNSKFKPSSIANTISNQKNELTGAEAYQKHTKEFYEKIVSRVYLKYEDYLRQVNAVDFDDLLLLPTAIFKKFPNILLKYQNQFQHILVDEYQDTNRAQYVLLKFLAASHKNLCVVGDDWQSIYSWRGADFRNILLFEKDYPQAKTVFLEENYRSSQNILDAAHAVIQKNIYKTNKKLWTKKTPGAKIKIIETASEAEEGRFVVTEIKTVLAQDNSKNLNDFAVLYRTNAQSRALEEAIIEAGWPYKMVGAFKFYERKEIKDVLSYLRFIQNPNDTLSLRRIINVPPRGVGKKTQGLQLNSKLSPPLNQKIKGFFELIEFLRAQLKNKKLTHFLKTLLEKINYKDYILDGTVEGESRWENILELITVASKFDSSPGREALTNFLEEIALITTGDDVSDKKGELNLMTLHAAKGLEFAVVFIAGAEEGLLPHERSSFDLAQMEEERRLCYVGLTRAKERIYFVLARNRNLYGAARENLPSRFLGDIPAKLVEFTSLNEGENIIEI